MCNLICPACGSSAVVRDRPVLRVKARGGPVLEYNGWRDVCVLCRESFSVSDLEDPIIKETLRQSERRSIQESLRFLETQGYAAATLERILQIPQRTMEEWQVRKFPPGAAVLLFILKKHPDLLRELDWEQ